jgi:hypothetical protein
MRSPWDSDYRTRQEYDDHRSSERSTSAPPPETPLDFGRGDAAARENVSKESIILATYRFCSDGIPFFSPSFFLMIADLSRRRNDPE